MKRTFLEVLKKIIPPAVRRNPMVQKLRSKLVFKALLSKRLKRQLSFSDGKIILTPFAGKRILVPIIETSHYQHNHILGIAKALQLRGAEVKVLICGEVLDGCEIKSLRKEGDPDPCWSCRFHAQHTSPLYGLETVTLADFVSSAERAAIRQKANQSVANQTSLESYGIRLDQAVQDSIVRYYYGAVPSDERSVATVRETHSMSALLTAEVAHRIDQQWHPDIVMNNMPCYSAWEPFSRYYRDYGDRFRLISLTAYDFGKITFNYSDLYKNTSRFREYMDYRKSLPLSNGELGLLEAFMGNRIEGSSDIFRVDGCFKSIEIKETIATLNIDSNKRNIFLFSNMYWDVGVSEMAALYPDIISFVLGTLELLKDRPNIHLYIKPHPGEVFASSSSLKGISQIIREKYPVLPSNVAIIEPELKIKPYDLFPHIDVGVIFSGTIGLEMMLGGVPVVSTGQTAYYGLNLAAEPKTESEYLEFILGERETPNYNLDDLKLFAYFFFIRASMPWTLTKQAYGDVFVGFSFESLDDMLPGKDPILDHLCNCIVDLENTVVEAWPDSEPHTVQSS